MPVLTPERHLENRNSLPPFNPPHSLPSSLQRASLLDVNFEMRRKRKLLERIRSVADVPNRFQSIPQRLATAVVGFALVRGADGALTRKHTRRAERRKEPRALLVRPVDDGDRREGLDVLLLQAADDFQRPDHAQRPVEAAACYYGVQV